MTAPAREFTAEQIRAGIYSAVHEGKLDIAESLIKLLAVWYPAEFETLRTAVDLAQLYRGGE